jgi:hypothetical protein
MLYQDGKTFVEEEVVFTGGTMYRHCKFVRCRIIVRPSALSAAPLLPIESAQFEFCTWHLDVTLSDWDRWAQLKEALPLLMPPKRYPSR